MCLQTSRDNKTRQHHVEQGHQPLLTLAGFCTWNVRFKGRGRTPPRTPASDILGRLARKRAAMVQDSIHLDPLGCSADLVNRLGNGLFGASYGFFWGLVGDAEWTS